jgi:hypothetical protein
MYLNEPTSSRRMLNYSFDRDLKTKHMESMERSLRTIQFKIEWKSGLSFSNNIYSIFCIYKCHVQINKLYKLIYIRISYRFQAV